MSSAAPSLIRIERRLNPFALRVIREARGYQQQDAFATAVECSPGFYSRLESGRRQPSEATLARICNVLEIDVRAITSEVNVFGVGAA